DLCSLYERLLIAAASATPQLLRSIRATDVRC
ncbi:MAG TPA: IS1595 family transposase, partial [Nitrosomonas europaea]|nr:IS1595 family transposase [Nitrosomonas europaea]